MDCFLTVSTGGRQVRQVDLAPVFTDPRMSERQGMLESNHLNAANCYIYMLGYHHLYF